MKTEVINFGLHSHKNRQDKYWGILEKLDIFLLFLNKEKKKEKRKKMSNGYLNVSWLK